MKQKINLLLFFGLVSVGVSTPHGTKGGSISGTYSASSSSSQSSSSSSSSSSQFTATGSFNGLEPGLKLTDLVGKLGHGEANSGSHFGSLGSVGASNGAGLSGAGSTSGAFGNSGSGAFTGVKGNYGVAGSGSTSGSIAGSFSGISCGQGKKDCGGNSGSKNGDLSGAGSQSSSGVTGNSEKEGTDGHTAAASGSRGTTSSGFDVSGNLQNSGTYGSIRPVSQPVNIVKESPVTEKEEESFGSWSGSGTNANTIPESSGTVGSSQGSSSGLYTGSSIAGSSPGSNFPSGGQPTISAHPSGQGNPPSSSFPVGGHPSGDRYHPGSGLPIGGQLTTSAHPSGQGTSPGSGFPVRGQQPASAPSHGNLPSSGQPTISYYPSGQGHQHPSPGPITNGPSGINTGSQSGSFTNNFGSHIGVNEHVNETPKKPCCTGPFPGPSGSIHASKPAHLVPPIPSPGGSFSSSGVNNGGVFVAGSGTAGVTTGGSGFIPGSKVACCKGPFPGPHGSIHDSKPAHQIPSNPSTSGPHPVFPTVGPSYPSSGSHETGSNGGYVPSNTFGSPDTVGLRPPKPNFPGPSGSIHESKPANSVAPVASSGNKYTGPFPGSPGGILTSVPVITGSPSPAIRGPVVISRYPSHPTTFIDKPTEVSNPGYATGTVTVQKPDVSPQQGSPSSGSLIYGSTDSGNGKTYENGFATGNVVVQKPDGSETGGKDLPSGSLIYGSTDSGNGKTYENGFATGNVVVQKPGGSVTGGKDLPSGSLIYGSTDSGNGKTYENGFATGNVVVQKPDGSVTGGKDLPSSSPTGISSESHVEFGGSSSIPTRFESSGTTFGFGSEKPSIASNPVIISRPIVTGQYPSVQNPTTIKPAGASASTFATGAVQSLDDNQSQKKPSDDFLIHGSTGSGSRNGYDNGFATGHVAIQKPVGSVTGGNNLPSQHSAGISSDSYAGSGSFATGHLVSQKPDGSASGNRYIIGTTTGGSQAGPGSRVYITQITSGSPSSGELGSLDSGNGYAVGGVLIQKPDGSLTTGKDSSLGTSGTYSSGIKGGFGQKGNAGSYTFGLSSGGAYGSSPGGDLFGLSDNGPFVGHEGGAIKGSSGFGSYAGAGAYSGASAGPAAFSGHKSGSYAGAQSGAATGFTGLLKGLVGPHGLGGNLGIAGAGSGSFSKSHSYASSASYAGSSSSSYSGHY